MKYIKKLIIVSDVSNDDFEEDIFLMNFLKERYQVALTDLKGLSAIEDTADCILFKCAWPKITDSRGLNEYNVLSNSVKERMRKKKLNTFNDLRGSGDVRGKGYLFELFSKGFPVIPLVRSVKDVKKLPKQKYYFIKPFNGLSSYGAQKVLRKELEQYQNKRNLIIQPFIPFEYEVSFYFLGNTFQYALYAPDTKSRWELKPYNPNRKDLEFAQQFVDWNTLEDGLQRVDACRTIQGDLLLMELEDDYPLWSFLELPIKQRIKFLKHFLNALEQIL